MPHGADPIAFISGRDGNYDIYVMNSDGSNHTKLTENPFDDRFPSWSPDGTQITFDSWQAGNTEIYIMYADGSGQARLTNNSIRDEEPSWSPDGTKIAFTSETEDSFVAIYVMNANGTNRTRLIRMSRFQGWDAYPSWSPNGALIVYSYDMSSGSGISSRDTLENRHGNRAIYVTNGDCCSQVAMRLTDNLGDDLTPSWSPSNTKIAFASDRNGNYDIFVMDADGSNKTRLTNDPGMDLFPSWSSDGTRIAFTSNRDGNQEIYVMNSDGSDQTNLTNNPAHDAAPSWKPGG